MTSLTTRSSSTKRIAAIGAVLGLATLGIAAAPKPAAAWWRHYGYGWGGVGVYVPPVYVAPPPVYVAPPPAYYPAPAYYAPPQRAWIPAHWQNGYWVPGHWS